MLRHRLEALSREKENVAEGASAKVEELEKKVLEGELQRRKMHNLIQVGLALWWGQEAGGRGRGVRHGGERRGLCGARDTCCEGETLGKWEGSARDSFFFLG